MSFYLVKNKLNLRISLFIKLQHNLNTAEISNNLVHMKQIMYNLHKDTNFLLRSDKQLIKNVDIYFIYDLREVPLC